MNRAEFMKTFGLGVATATVAPKVLFKSKEERNRVNIQPAENYIKRFNGDHVIVFESVEGELEQGRNIGGKLLPINPDKDYVPIEKINVGNFEPQLLYSPMEVI